VVDVAAALLLLGGEYTSGVRVQDPLDGPLGRPVGLQPPAAVSLDEQQYRTPVLAALAADSSQPAVPEAEQLREPVNRLASGEIGLNVEPGSDKQLLAAREPPVGLAHRLGKEIAPARDQECGDLDPLDRDHSLAPVVVVVRVVEPAQGVRSLALQPLET